MKLIDLAELDEDVSLELVSVNYIGGVISFVADNYEVTNTSLCLNIAEIWFYDIEEVSSGENIVELKQLSLCSFSRLLTR